MTNVEDQETEVQKPQDLQESDCKISNPLKRNKLNNTAALVRNVTLMIILFSLLLWLNTYICFDIESSPKDLEDNERPSTVPSIIWFTNIISSVSKIQWVLRNRSINCSKGVRTFKCDVLRPVSQPENPGAYLFYISYLDRFPLPRDPKTIWGLIHDESPVARLVLLFEEALNVFNFSATFGRNSNVPFPLIWMRSLENVVSPQYYVPTSKKNSLLGSIAPVVYMQSDCASLTERDDYVQKLMEYIKIDSYGDCLHNKDLPLNERYYSDPDRTKMYRFHLYGEELLSFLAQYKFIIAIEVGVCNDYVTEKFWRSIELGVVPIYYGSPLIRDWLPNKKSAILLEDFPTPELVSQHLHYLLQNDTAYEEYLEHKTLGLVSNQKLIDEIVERPYQTDLGEVVKKFECFICEKLHDKDKSVNVVSKRHFDCPIAETLSYVWQIDINDSVTKIDDMFEEMGSDNMTRRLSKTSWW